MRYESDLLVIGGGMGGMTGAYWAAKQGKRVVVVEKAPQIGGSAVLSGTHLWTARTFEDLREQCPEGDPELGAAFLEAFAVAADFVRSTGVETTEQIAVLYGEGFRFDIIEYFQRAKRAVEMNEGWVLPNTYVEQLIQDDDGVVIGATVRDADGFTEVMAPVTLLATGGFQANRALIEQHIGQRGANMLLRSNFYSSGDGLRLGQSVGGATAGKMDTFYGHLIAWPLREFLPKDFGRLSMMFSTSTVMLNTEGRRFTDESLADHLNNQRVAEQPGGRAVLVFDERVRSTDAVAPVTKGFEAIDLVREAQDAGAHVAKADDIEALCRIVGEWGYDAASAARAIETFNTTIGSDGQDPDAEPPRQEHRKPVLTAPFYAVEVRPGITFTEGGLRIDSNARVLDLDGAPIPGLFATGADTGGVFNGGYGGGLALAAAFGIQAASAAMLNNSYV